MRKARTASTDPKGGYSKMIKLEFPLASPPSPVNGLSLALGNFDGFHLGHQSLALKAKEGEGPSGILFFKNPFDASKPLLSDLEDKIRYANPFDLDYAYVLDNDPSFYSLSKADFLFFLRGLGVARVVVGEDFRFGKNQEGGISDLQETFQTEVCPLITDESGNKISSSSIRELLKSGKVEEARKELGRPYEIKGTVVHGFENGRKIGFPTLNLDLSSPYLLPASGVYAGLTYLSGIPYPSMINVGSNPTVGKLLAPIAESHLLTEKDIDGYGKRAYFAFYARLRGEKRFSSLEELKAQLEQDEVSTREALEKL